MFEINLNFLLSNTKFESYYLELSSLYLRLYQQTDGIKEIIASKGMHLVRIEKSPDRHLSIHPR